MNRPNRLLIIATLCVLCLALGPPLLAQTTTRGEIFGRITDDRGSPLADAAVVLKAPDLVTPLKATTGADGTYRLVDIRPGKFTMTIELAGYTTLGPIDADVRVGSVTKFDHVMKLAGAVTEAVGVTASVPQIESVKSQVNKYISLNELQNLPLQNRNFLDVLRTVPGISTGVPTGTYSDRGPRNSFNIHGARSNQNDFMLDGAANNDKSDLNYEDIASVQILGGPRSGNAGRAGQTFQVGTALQTYNLDAMQEVQVSTSMFSAEFGSGGSGGVINVITRSGGDFLAGSVTAQQQRDAWVKGSEKQSIKRDLAAVSLGGPFVKEKTHFFASYERDDQKLGFDFSQPSYYVPNYLRNPNSDLTANHTLRDRFTFKLSQIFNPSHTLALTTNFMNERADVLQTIFRDRSIDDNVPEHYENKSLALIVRDLAVLSENRILESVLSTTGVDRNFDSSNDNPREIFNYYVPSYHSYTIGTNSPDTTNTIRTFGWSEKLSAMGSKTSSKFGIGVDYFRQRSQQIEYLSLYHYPETNETSYLRIPPTDLTVSVTDIYTFAQTDWFVNPKTTLNLGLRLGHDNLVGQTTVEPRIGVAYDPQGNGRQVIRAGVGIYHDRSNLIGETGALRPPIDMGDVIDGELVPSGLPTLTQVDPNLKLPTIYKAVLGYQRQLGQNTTAGITLFANYNRDLFFVSNLNRPDINDNRADPTKGTIVFYSNFGKSDVYDAELEFRHTFKNGSMVQASYTYEHTRGNSSFDFLSGNDDINRATYKEGQMQTYEVWGPLAFDTEHTLKASGVFMLPWGFQCSTFMQWNTGRPYFWYTTWYELPAYFPHFEFYGGGYNSQRLDNQFNMDIRLAWGTKIKSTNLVVFFDMFNVTDKENVLQRNGLYAYNYGKPIGEAGTVFYSRYDQPNFYGPRRSAQLGVRFSF
jgi:outer membrane receptor for ferrienterochelin and colicin